MANSTAFTSGRDLSSVAENVELLTGQRGNKLDKAVTYRDLESLGVATLSRIGSNYKATSNPVLTTTVGVVDSPTKPQNVQAHGAFNTILIDWDEPDYRGHSYAEVWRSETDNLSAAVKVGTTSARMYSDPIGGDASVYYWVRFVNANNVTGPFNSSAGTHAETAVDVQQLLDSLTGQIEESQLAQSLTEKIGLIDTNIASIQQINTNIKQIDVDFQQITVDLSSLSDRQAQAEAILKSAQDLLGSTTIDVALLHDQLSQQVQKYGADVQNLTNAILTVNPATGEVTIDAVNVVRTELQTSIDEVSQRVSSVEGTLTQKASSTDVTLQSQRISTVETKLDSINSELTNQVTRAEFTDTQEDVTQLTTRMSAAEGSISTKAEQQTVTNLSTRIASAETKLIAVNDDLTSKATQISGLQSSYQSASSDIAGNSEAIAANTASITELSQTITDNESATSQRLDGLDSSVSGMHSAITSLQQTTSNAIEATASNYSHLKAQTDLTALAAANAALSDDESSRSSRSSEASIRTNLKVLTSDHESLAKTVEVLQADFETETSSLSAHIATEQTARTTAIESLSQQITTLDSAYKSSDSTISASIAAEQTARATADTALSQQITILQASVNDNLAEIQSEQTARVTADESLSQQITTLKSEYKAADSTLSASIATEQTARTAADSALSQQINVVQSAVDGNTSAIQSEQTARTTADAALAQDIATLIASVGTNSAAIQSESTARASADSALTSLVNTAQAKADSAYSAVQTEITNRTTADSALSQSIATLQASVASNAAAIQSESTARANADSAMASNITTVQAYVNGDISNLFLNPTFTNEVHGFSSGTVRYSGYAYMPDNNPTANCLEVNCRDTLGKTIPVSPGDVYHASITCATTNSGSPALGVGFFVRDKAGTILAYAKVATRDASDALGTWKTISGNYTVPANGASIQLWVQMDYFPPNDKWWMITNVQFTNANATRSVSALLLSEQTARIDADSSLSQRIDTVQATANNLTASVQTQSQAISTLENGAQAMWTAKTQVGQITAGIGVMTDSNGKSQVMISASQLFMFDPNGAAPTRSIFAVSDGKVVIQKAVIEKATIETVTAMSITADYVRAGVSITSPAINGGTLAIGSGDNSCFMEGGSIGIGKGGPYGGWGWGWHTIIYNDGGLYTDRLHASSGDFTGYVHATSGYFENVTIAENCDVRGTIYANKIVGDVIAIKPMNLGFYTGRAPYKIYKNQEVAAFSFNLSASNVARYIKINGSSCDGSNVYMKLYIGGDLVASRPNGVDGLYAVPAKSGVTVVQFNLWYVNNGADYIYTTARLVGEVVVYPVSSGTFV